MEHTNSLGTESPQNPSDSMPGDQPDPLLDSKLLLRAELKFDARTEDGKSFVVIEDPIRSKYFQVGTREYQFIASIDGRRTPREILEQLAVNDSASNATSNPLDEEAARTICQWLMQSNLAVGDHVDNAKRLNQQATSMRKAKLFSILNPISCKFPLFNPNKILTSVQPAIQWIFTGWFLVAWLIMAIWACTTIYSEWDRLGDASAGILSGYSWIWLVLTWFILKVIHELAHGVACKRYGGEVPEAGVLLLLFTPMAYVNVTSMWRFANRWHRMVVAAAGMYIELFISFLAIILWSKSSGFTAEIAYNVFITASLTTILFNANPLMRFDGYFLLSDGLAIPNLYTKGTKWFGEHIRSKFFGIPKAPNQFPNREFRAVATYGVLAFFWKLSISVSLIIGAGVLFHGAGIALSVFGVALWFGLPIYKQFQSAFSENAPHQVRPFRVALSCLTLALAFIMTFYVLKAPSTKSAPAIVQFSNETTLRAGADGFVDEILVKDGEKVQQGQLLVVLKNPKIHSEVKILEQLAKEAKIQSRIYQQTKENALAQAEQKKFEETIEQLNEKRDEAEGLRIVAPFDGFVYRRNLNHQLGNFSKRGDAILTIAQKQTKEVVVSIDQRDVESLKDAQGDMVRVALPGVDTFQSPLNRVDPGATQKPSHPTLCANAGGPLAVRPASSDNDASAEDSSFEFLNPRFNIILELDSSTSQQLQAGQRGRAFFATKQQSLGGYLFIATSEWLRSKIEMATQTAVF